MAKQQQIKVSAKHKAIIEAMPDAIKQSVLKSEHHTFFGPLVYNTKTGKLERLWWIDLFHLKDYIGYPEIQYVQSLSAPASAEGQGKEANEC